MLIFGLNVLKEVDSKKVKKAYCSRKDLLPILKEKNIKYIFKNHTFLDNLVGGNHQGIILDVDEYAYYDLASVKGDFVVALDHLEDPHNFGSIIRTCVAAGIKEIIIPKDRSVSVNSTVVKVSSGMIENIKIVRVTNLAEALKKLQKKGYFIYIADMTGTDYKKVNYASKKVLVIGNEGKGISHLIKEITDECISIPINRNAESLNAGVAAGILIYEMKDKNEY